MITHEKRLHAAINSLVRTGSSVSRVAGWLEMSVDEVQEQLAHNGAPRTSVADIAEEMGVTREEVEDAFDQIPDTASARTSDVLFTNALVPVEAAAKAKAILANRKL